MIRVTCYCSCGVTHWTQDYEDGNEEFRHVEGVADDCPECNTQKSRGNSYPDNTFKRAMRNVTPLKPKRGTR